MKVKICGMMDAEHALAALRMGADAVGFVFASSPRQVSLERARSIIRQLPQKGEKVGVFVNESRENMEAAVDYCGLTMVQLHGDESDVLCSSLSVPAIKAVGIRSEKDAFRAFRYTSPYLLADSPKEIYHGGNGKTFDWGLLTRLQAGMEGRKLILAGGLTADNVEQAIALAKPYMVDVSSGVESNGVKDLKKMEAFIKKAKGAM